MSKRRPVPAMPSIFGFVLLLATASHGLPAVQSKCEHVVNANHIFNAIHDSMRQFGSSINHNGMSVFLATVPKDTEFYHGTSHPDRVNGTEWLAFEPEHAMMFARGPIARFPPKDPPDDQGYAPVASGGGLQRLLDDGKRPPPRPHGPGYFHTYRAKHDLRLLYVDGQSAAKSSKGTLDVEDYILLPHPPSSDPGEWLPFHDVARAKGICKIASTEWKGRIDGVIRMEAGFEIILCDFEKDLDVVDIAQADDFMNHPDHEIFEDTFNYYKAISARYDGIGGGRVRLDYGHFITLFSHQEVMYFDDGLPRIDNTSKAIKNVRNLVKDLAIRDDDLIGTDWQAVTDLFIARYAHRIAYLTSGMLTNLTTFRAEVDRALRPFIDYSERNSTAEVNRCRYQFLPTIPAPASLAYNTILNITTTICSTLSSILNDDIDFDSAVSRVQGLRDWLNWSEWKKCQGCGYHEICFLAIWPIGNKEDLVSPKCRSTLTGLSFDYWMDDVHPRDRTWEW